MLTSIAYQAQGTLVVICKLLFKLRMMKKIYILTTLFFAIGIAGCKKNFLSQEINPNQPSVASPQNLLSGAETISAYIVNGGGGNNYYSVWGVWMGQICPSGNYVPSATLETYSFTNASFQVFVPLFNNLANYNALIAQTSSSASLAYFTAIAKIMTAYDYQQLVDNYGNVPYSQALNSSVYLFPAYDSGSAIYDDLLVQLDKAIALINANSSATNPGSSDVIFGGNMTSWKKFANTLKLRIAIRQSNITSKFAALKTSLAGTATEGYLDDNTFATANPGYLASDANGGQQSPFWLGYGYTAAGAEIYGHAYYRANSFEVSLLNTYGDARVSQIYAPISGTVTGATLGSTSNGSNSVVSAFGPGLLISPSMNAVLLSGSEACFLVSEGDVDGLISTGTAQDYYQRGITASFVALQVPNAATAAAAYYTQNVANVGWAASAANLQSAIITQKYIALTGYGFFEVYNEWRRTGYPNLAGARSIKAGALTAAGVPAPYRIYYPSTEYQTNATAVGALPTVDPFNTKIFWAK